MVDPGAGDEVPFHGWDEGEEELELAPPGWRKPALIAVAAVTAIAMAMVPVYNVFWSRTIAENGLEVCGFDYCIVQESVRLAGLDLEMSRLYNSLLDENEAKALADELTRFMGIAPVGLSVVDDLGRRLGGVFDPATRWIEIERPARAWTVIHEVAHAVETGHDERFQAVVIDLTRWISD